MISKEMKGKRHPVLIALVVIGAVALFLGGVMTLVLKFTAQPSALSFGHKIGVIPIEGTILDSEPVLTQLIQFKNDKQIKAIILRINSPGGGVAPSQEIYREIRRTKKTKKIIASMGSLAASGGYYIAAASDKIVANPGTLTGSIGVIMDFIHVEELMEKLGLGMEVLKSGEFKDIGYPHRKLTERDRALIMEVMAEIQGQFVDAVAQGRNLPREKVLEVADGRVFSGTQAKELGLVDVLGNFRDAVELAKEMTDIEREVTLVYPKKAHKRFWEFFLEDTSRVLLKVLKTALGPRMEYRWPGLTD